MKSRKIRPAPAKSSWVVYIVKCADGTLYTGVSTDAPRRVREHNGELAGGARYTRPRRPVKLVYTEKADNRSEAGKREAEIKKMSRTDKKKLFKRR